MKPLFSCGSGTPICTVNKPPCCSALEPVTTFWSTATSDTISPTQWRAVVNSVQKGEEEVLFLFWHNTTSAVGGKRLCRLWCLQSENWIMCKTLSSDSLSLLATSCISSGERRRHERGGRQAGGEDWRLYRNTELWEQSGPVNCVINTLALTGVV